MTNGDWFQFATFNHQIVYQMVIFIYIYHTMVQWLLGRLDSIQSPICSGRLIYIQHFNIWYIYIYIHNVTYYKV